MGWNLFLFFCGRTTWVRPPDSETTVAVKESIDPYSEDFTNELDHLKRYETCSTSGWLGGWAGRWVRACARSTCNRPPTSQPKTHAHAGPYDSVRYLACIL